MPNAIKFSISTTHPIPKDGDHIFTIKTSPRISEIGAYISKPLKNGKHMIFDKGVFQGKDGVVPIELNMSEVSKTRSVTLVFFKENQEKDCGCSFFPSLKLRYISKKKNKSKLTL